MNIKTNKVKYRTRQIKETNKLLLLIETAVWQKSEYKQN